MTEFKHVQWGAGIPVEYQRLMAMMNNDQYLRDFAYKAPRGVLMWKAISSVSFNPDGGLQLISGLTNLPFSCEANRLISIEFNSGILVSDAGGEIRMSFVIDGVSQPQSSGLYIAVTGGTIGTLPLITVPSTTLAQGAHTVSLQVQANVTITSLTLGGSSGNPLIVVRDEGAWIDPAP